jgi:hypothetical protein
MGKAAARLPEADLSPARRAGLQTGLEDGANCKNVIEITFIDADHSTILGL